MVVLYTLFDTTAFRCWVSPIASLIPALASLALLL
jgi:hypothetical protein